MLNKYSWRSNSFSEGITGDGIRDLVRDVETIKNGPKEIIVPPPMMKHDDLPEADDEYTSADETSADESFYNHPFIQPPPKHTAAKVNCHQSFIQYRCTTTTFYF